MSLVRRFSKRIDDYLQSRAPYNGDGDVQQTDVVEKKVKDIQSFVHGPPITMSSISSIMDAIKNLGGVGLDDRELLLENSIVFMSSLNKVDPTLASKTQQTLINLLYKDLPHPPSGYVCLPPPTQLPVNATPSVSYAFRSADGSNYNPLFPTIGKAGSPYARSVPSTNNSPKNALPDAGLVFDSLLKRDEFVEHPGGISSLFFAFADLVIHSIFNTDTCDPSRLINKTSSYLDLSVLYGNSAADVASIRLNDGTGRLHPDVFADWRLLHMPPASCALLVLLSRNHNFIAQRILDINENNTYYNPALATPEQKAAQDEEIFQRTRLVNCGYFMHIVLGDYVGAILGLVRDQTEWRLDPLQNIRQLNHEFVPVGEGNVVSIEFNLLYRWHSTLSQQNEEWFKTQVFDKVFPAQSPSEITPTDFLRVVHTPSFLPGDDITQWTFGGLKRDPTSGCFKDEELAKILQDATANYAGAFKARGIPEHMRVIEIMAIEQSRNWGTCSLNEFRKFLGLKPYATFKEWNPDEKIHTAAAALYRDIDNLELHVGLQAEEAKKPGPGAGLCPGYTISRAILADAVCLSRGDRYLTVDLTPHNLTAWGYQDCQYDPKDGSFGGLLTKLLYRTLPDFYPPGSAYAHFPFMQPDSMKKAMTDSNPELADKYTWSYPQPLPKTVGVYDFEDVKNILDHPKPDMSKYDTQLVKIVPSRVFTKPSTLGSKFRNSTISMRGEKAEFKQVKDTQAAHTKFSQNLPKISDYVFSKASPEVAHYFSKKTEYLINTKSFESVGTSIGYVDIVRDVLNLLPIYWLSQEIAGIPLKTAANERGFWLDKDYYDKIAEITEYVYLDFDPTDDWHLRESSQDTARESINIIKAHIDKIDSLMSLSDAQNHLAMPTSSSCHAYLRKLWNTLGKPSGTSHELFASQIFAATFPTAALYSQALATVVNFYLADTESCKKARQEIIALNASTDQDASAKAMVYVYEALRVDPPVAGVYRTADMDLTLKSVEVKAGQNIFLSIRDANLDKSVFGDNAGQPDFLRAEKKPGVVAFERGFLTSEFFQNTVPPVLAAIFSLKDLERAPGDSGSITKFTEEWQGTERSLFASQRGLVTPWPESLLIQFAK